ncbi:Protein kinase domain [Arabidopsis thaliana x Arabidopsis arenosa]|uniref:Protein kinase domain n=1 Tax=Arabidopsis thaliana x Arabidopsis arenosa TaxID=1240361 RepID=A0A8T2C1D9_9BRAS|nr:Protein kinase domain [Arabidopsis thaliana x Arabidopsis arenosa]
MTSSSGTKFPLDTKDYELLEKIGDCVYRARCILLDEIVAIKIWNLEKCTNDLENIKKEVHRLSSIDHPNLLRPHCSFIDGGNLWIVMPYMACGSCLNIMKSVYPNGLEEPVIAIFLREILKALVYLHGLGYIHGNVKAGNILVDSEGTVKLGVERMPTSSGNTFVGTPCWIAPEEDTQQVDGYDFKLDIWSFGVTALELSHGHSPFSKYPHTVALPLTLQNSPCPDYEEDKKFSKSFRELYDSCNSLYPLGERFRKLKEEEAKLVKGIDGNKEKLPQVTIEALLTSGKPASPVNPVSCNAAKILPMLQNLVIQNDIQRERLISLMQLYDPNAGKFAVLSADFASSLCYKFRDLI